MRIVIYGDAHWCQYSSIVRKQGEKYSVRLENLIKSINWVESTATEQGCECIINLGDFFDKSELNAEEITALNDVKWNHDITHFNIIGNHEMGRNDLSTSSCDLFNLIPNNIIIYKPSIFSLGECELSFLPYCLEDKRTPISFPVKTVRRILFSHNDIKGIQMGQFISQQGYTIEEMESCCDLCFNGHLHSGKQISDKIINVGNLTGQNFSEDAHLYAHGVYIIETDDLSYVFIENPHAFNFYKIDLTNTDFSSYNKFHFNVKENAVCSIKCTNSQVEFLREALTYNTNVIESRLIISPEKQEYVDSIIDVDSFSIDHIKYFNEFILNNYENTDILLQELAEVSK